MSAVYNYIHFKFVNTEFADYQMELIRARWEQAGMSATQMEQAEHMTRAMIGPVSTAIMTPIMAVLFGLVISLIVSIFLKRPAPPEAPAA
jgi:hypothetical protein